MPSTRSFNFRSLRLRRIITGVALLAYLASVWGFPMPTVGMVDASTPFPCQHHRCGCQSADQCWRNCCCFTPEQRIAWARENHVTIPAEVQLALAAEMDEHASHEDHEHADCCSDHHTGGAGCHDKASAEPESHACAKCGVLEGKSGVTWVLGIEARKCRGLSTQWIAAGASLPLQILSLWEFDWTPVGQVMSTTDPLCSIAFAPSVPPPRA